MHPRHLILALATLVACAAKPVSTPPGSSGGAAGATADGPAEDPATAAALQAAVDGAHRSPEHRARDAHRHPAETLQFFGLRQDMTVVELWPGGSGWFTEILAPVLRERGKLIATNFDTSGPEDAYQTKSGKKFLDKLASSPAVYDRVQVVTVKDTKSLVLAPEGSVDMVLTFRNTHNWVEDQIEGDIYGAAFKALKSGGVLGIEQHRGKPGPVADPVAQAKTGYLPEDWVISRVESFGFKFAGKSEVNANPRDTKDHDKGVWALPPVLENGDKDRDRYVAIGESDRMTLKFVKP